MFIIRSDTPYVVQLIYLLGYVLDKENPCMQARILEDLNRLLITYSNCIDMFNNSFNLRFC